MPREREVRRGKGGLGDKRGWGKEGEKRERV